MPTDPTHYAGGYFTPSRPLLGGSGSPDYIIPKSALPKFLDDAIRAYVTRIIQTENDRIEADLLSLPGVRPDMTAAEAREMGLEFAHQRRSLVSEYRGIRANGEWLIDHHPEWGEVHDEMPRP